MGLPMLAELARPSSNPSECLFERDEDFFFLHSSKYYLSSLLGFLVIEMVANWGKQYSSLTVLFPDVSD